MHVWPLMGQKTCNCYKVFRDEENPPLIILPFMNLVCSACSVLIQLEGGKSILHSNLLQSL